MSSDHGQEQFAKVLRLLFLLRGEAHATDLRDPFDKVCDVVAEVLPDRADIGQGVLHDVVEEADADAGHVQPQLRQNVGHLEGMSQVGLAGLTHLPLVFPGGENVGLAKQFDVGVGMVSLNRLL
jgi:hypothetical protein